MKFVTIDGVIFRPVSAEGMRKTIIIVDNRGLTFVGDVDWDAGGDDVLIKDAQCVIRWGTTKHLAELAKNGPTDGTKLGEKHDFYARRQHVIGRYLCGEAWG